MVEVSHEIEGDAEGLPVRHIFRWDLDKTYLQTDFDTIKGLIRAAIERAEEKANVPGAVALLQELSRPTEQGRALVTFISGSPTQMRGVLQRKFEIDGIHPDAFILKPTLQNILRGRFKAVRGQVGYKLEALLRVRQRAPAAPETLFGDDAEQDAFIYSLYADVTRGVIHGDTLRDILVEAEVYASTMAKILELAGSLEPDGQVGRIFINLERGSAPGRFLPFGPRVVPIDNYFQAALVLWADGVLGADGLLRAAAGMIARDDFGIAQLSGAFRDLMRRGVLDPSSADRFAADCSNVEVPHLPSGFVEKMSARVRGLAPRRADARREWMGPPDYVEILRHDRALKNAVTEGRR